MPLATRSPSGTTRSFVWSSPGIDEVSLALVADGWSRTDRSRTLTFATTESGELSRNGVRIFFPDKIANNWPAERLLPGLTNKQSAKALDEALQGIAGRCGAPTADFVAMQLEYPSQR